MTQKEFIEYIETLLSAKEVFFDLSREDQEARNKRRTPKKRWSEEKIERAVEKTWIELLGSIHRTLQVTLVRTPRERWIEYLDQEGFIESIDQSITEIEFD